MSDVVSGFSLARSVIEKKLANREFCESIIDAVCEAIGVDSGAFDDYRMDRAIAALHAAMTK